MRKQFGQPYMFGASTSGGGSTTATLTDVLGATHTIGKNEAFVLTDLTVFDANTELPGGLVSAVYLFQNSTAFAALPVLVLRSGETWLTDGDGVLFSPGSQPAISTDSLGSSPVYITGCGYVMPATSFGYPPVGGISESNKNNPGA
jgi:hypothetical protein